MRVGKRLQDFLNIFLFLNLKRKVIVLSICFCISSFVIVLICMKPAWFYSFIVGGFSYIVLMIVSFRSIHAKIQNKIIQANKEQLLEQYASKYDKEMNNENSSRQVGEKKKLSRFIDFSKVSLGFELSFSLPRIITFLGMLLGFGILVWFHIFYPIAYILGVFVSSILVILYFFVLSWSKEESHNHVAKN